MIAFKHLNKLLIEKKQVEKFKNFIQPTVFCNCCPCACCFCVNKLVIAMWALLGKLQIWGLGLVAGEKGMLEAVCIFQYF